MNKASEQDFRFIKAILKKSFYDNKSVNFVLKNQKNKDLYLDRLLDYSNKYCNAFGHVFISEKKEGCVLLIDPKRKKITSQSLFWDISFATKIAGLKKVQVILRREKIIKEYHNKHEQFLHLWYIGVEPSIQGSGVGTTLLKETLKNASPKKILLETSNPSYLSWYKKNGFDVIGEEFMVNHYLYFLKHDNLPLLP